MGEFALPDRSFEATGIVSEAFARLGVTRFHQALRWLGDLKYGANRSDGPLAVFEDGQGTCATKHGAAATLALECGLRSVHKALVYYKLDPTRFNGVDSILSRRGLPYVPHCHCVLADGYSIVDLTFGNDMGKLRDVDEFDVMIRVEPFVSRESYETLLKQAIAIYRNLDSRLKTSTVDEILQTRMDCLDAHLRANKSVRPKAACGCD